MGQARGGRGQRDIATACGAPCVFPKKLSLDHGTLAMAGCTGSQEGGVWIVTCACTQASWWLQQQP